jgi:hypothetical protein
MSSSLLTKGIKILQAVWRLMPSTGGEGHVPDGLNRVEAADHILVSPLSVAKFPHLGILRFRGRTGPTRKFWQSLLSIAGIHKFVT